MSKPIIEGLLISAGYSSRMGDFKPLLKVKNESLIVNIIRKLLLVCDKVTVVTGFNCELIELELENEFGKELSSSSPKLNIVFNADFHNGMFSSVQCGVASISNSDWVLMHFVDQIGLPDKFYNEFISEVDDKYDWVQPVYNMQQGHPVLFKNTVFEKIIQSPSNYRMKLIRGDDEIIKKYWFTEYSGIVEDIDTQEDLVRYTKNS